MSKNKQEKKKQTIAEIIDEVKIAMCNDYCKYPHIWDEEKEGCELIDSDICLNCPLGRLG